MTYSSGQPNGWWKNVSLYRSNWINEKGKTIKMIPSGDPKLINGFK